MSTAAPSPPRCFCGATFDTHEHLLQHATAKGHRYRCSCGSSYKDAASLASHHTVTDHQGGEEVPAITRYIDTPGIDHISADTCTICRKPFANAVAVAQHKLDKHNVCSTCFQVFDSESARKGHQKASGHCYCDQHDLCFTDRSSFTRHERALPHVTGFECLDCDRSFKNQGALTHHIASCQASAPQRITDQEASAATAVAFAEAEEKALRCEACDRTFTSLLAQRSHKSSVKHKPLSEIRCFLSPSCKQVFTSPSAYLFHLESGKCKSGMNRHRLYCLVHAADGENTQRLAPAGAVDPAALSSALGRLSLSSTGSAVYTPSQTSVGSAQGQGHRGFPRSASSGASTSTATTATIRGRPLGNVSGGIIAEVDNDSDDDTDSATTIGGVDVRYTPEVSDTSSTRAGSAMGVRLTPSTTTVSSTTGGVVFTPASTVAGEWSFVPGFPGGQADLQYDVTKKGWPCTLCKSVFRTKGRLQQHLNSPAHETKLYHCGGIAAAVGGDVEPKKIKKFKTLSGFAQHLEAGSCSGGQEGLRVVAGLFEEELRKATGASVKLLRSSR